MSARLPLLPPPRSALKKPAAGDAPRESDQDPDRPRKRIRIDAGPAEAVVFHNLNPVDQLRRPVVVDLTAVEKADAAKALRRRLKESQLSVESTPRSSHQQAFSVFALPVVLDTNSLTVRELHAELRIRGLRLDGPKKQLAARLDKYLLEHERDRCVEGPA